MTAMQQVSMEDQDIGSLVSDSDISDDSSWMQKIDVSNFRQLAADSPTFKADFSTQPYRNERLCDDNPLSDSLKSEPSSPTDGCGGMNGDLFSAGRTRGVHPKPTYSYSCLIALALKNSRAGRLTVAEIYAFMCENFPYFRSAPNGWKNSVRHNLSLNKCFQKIELEAPGGHGRKSCLWMVNPGKAVKMDQEIKKWRDRDLDSIRDSLSCPDDLELIEQGQKGLPRDCDTSYSYHALPEIVTNSTNSQLFLVKAASNSKKYSIQSYEYEEPVLKWTVLPPAESPPRASAPAANRLPGESASAAAARNLQAALAQRSPSHYSTPLRPSQSSAPNNLNFTPTPPYSPNLEKEWAQQGLYSPQFSSTPYAYGTCPYETANSALNNNSLLQSALAQSPCRAVGAPLTFQSL